MRHAAKGACRWPSYIAQGVGLGGGLGDARAQEPSGSVARVPWQQVLGHGIAASAAAACYDKRQWHNGAQQHEGTTRSTIGGRW
jgi:hypothetical protein